MLILVTGPDNAGKTTLCKNLSRDLDIPIVTRFHTLPPPRSDADAYTDWCYKLLYDSIYTNLISDRGIVDEFVYGPLLRGWMVFKEADMHRLVKLLSSHWVQHIRCRPPLANQLATMDVRPQLADVKTRIETINNWFDFFYDSFLNTCRREVYDYTQPNAYMKIYEQLKGVIK